MQITVKFEIIPIAEIKQNERSARNDIEQFTRIVLLSQYKMNIFDK